MKKQSKFSPKLIWRIVLAILLISLITVLFIVSKNQRSYADADGNVVILVNDKDNNIVSKERLEYKKGDTLYNLIDKNYSLVCDNTTYGHYLKGISGEGFSLTTDGFSEWLWFEVFYLNDGASYSENIDFNDYTAQNVSTGIDGIALVDNMIFAINERDATHNASVLGNDIFINSSQNKNNTLFIIAIVILSALLGGLLIWIVFDFIKKRNTKKITVRDMTLMVCLTAILFVQEEMLAFIPNIQFTFLLMLLYGSVLGPKRASIIMVIHVMLDNLFMSSFGVFTIVPMLIGYEITILFGYIFGKRNEYLLSVFAGLSAIIYSLLFIPINIYVYDVKPIVYIISDIPFTAIMAICNIFCVIYLYKPLYKVLNEQYNKEIEESNISFEE